MAAELVNPEIMICGNIPPGKLSCICRDILQKLVKLEPSKASQEHLVQRTLVSKRAANIQLRLTHGKRRKNNIKKEEAIKDPPQN